MKLSQFMQQTRNVLHSAGTVIEGAVTKVDSTLTSAAPFVDNILSLIPGSSPYVAGFDATKDLLDAIEAETANGWQPPASIKAALDKMHAAKDQIVAKSTTTAAAALPAAGATTS